MWDLERAAVRYFLNFDMSRKVDVDIADMMARGLVEAPRAVLFPPTSGGLRVDRLIDSNKTRLEAKDTAKYEYAVPGAIPVKSGDTPLTSEERSNSVSEAFGLFDEGEIEDEFLSIGTAKSKGTDRYIEDQYASADPSCKVQ